MKRTLVTLAHPPELAETPPTEFLIFSAGANDSTKGVAKFDDEAARLVLAEYAAQGNKCMVDLEHLSLDPAARNYRSDALAWFGLEVREGALWAVDVKWTPEGAERLASRKQIYPSPAFYTDETGRVVELVNVALTSLPATHNAPELIAANRIARTKPQTRNGAPMDPKLITEALDALEAGDSAKALEILKALIASAAGGSAEPPAGDEPPMAAGEMTPADEEKMQAASKKLAAASRVAKAAADLTGETKPESVIAALTALKSGAGEAGKLAIRLSALEADATKREVDEMIKANTKKIPPTLDAWARTQSPEALQAFLKQAPDVVGSPASPEVNAPQISERAKALCEKNKIDPKKFADFRAQMRRGQE